MLVLKIVTWYGHLRDTFVGKNSVHFSEIFFDNRVSEIILPAKVSRNLTDFSEYYYRLSVRRAMNTL
jgi:hypothetical protein